MKNYQDSKKQEQKINNLEAENLKLKAFLTRAMTMHLTDIGEDGLPKESMDDILIFWGEVRKIFF